MHRASILIVLLFVGQISAWPLTDPTDDAVMGDQSVPSNGSGVDLYGLSVVEDEKSLTFTLETEPWRPVGVMGFDGIGVWIPFTYGDASYAFNIGLYDSITLGNRHVLVRMYAEWTPEDNGRQVMSREPDESGEGTVVFTVEKSRIRDENGVPLVAGRSLENLYVYSYQIGVPPTNGIDPNPNDRMPDQETVSLAIEVGLPQSDLLQLIARDPLRWSNGGATTYAYEVIVHNRDNQTVFFEAEEIPDQWIVHLPPEMQAEKETVTVYVTTPDRHVHDGDETFKLVAVGEKEARISLGVHYPAIPMPAGHHPTVYFHAKGGSAPGSPADMIGTSMGTIGADLGKLYMNTLVEDEASHGRPIAGVHGFGQGDGDFWGWPILLEPRLRTGLNFTSEPSEIIIHTGETPAEITGTLVGELLYQDTSEATIFHRSHTEGRIIADFSMPATIGETWTAAWTNWNIPETSYHGPVSFGVNLKFYPENIPHTAPIYSDFTPTITGGEMTLPLGEYDDGVTIPITAEQAEEIASLGEESPEVEETPLPIFLAVFAIALAWRIRK